VLWAGCGSGYLRLSLLRGLGLAGLFVLSSSIPLVMAGTSDGEGLVCVALYRSATE
jgi:hypothetical protein